jgi:filamentous hemagglutinin family protein
MSLRKISKDWRRRSLVLLAIASTSAIAERPALAQIRSDSTLGAETSVVTSSTSNGALRSEINGGAIRGSNLFHSFLDFSIPLGESLYFQSPIGVSNIISRVTGVNPSNIEGTLGVAGGNANLFLLNPNGISLERRGYLVRPHQNLQHCSQ